MFATSCDMEDREFTERYTIHRMVEQEFVTTFNCGDEDLNGLNDQGTNDQGTVL